MNREIWYTFKLKLNQEDEEWEGAFEDGLEHILETVGFIDDGDDGTVFSIDLERTVVSA